jgi:hypothetical protein
VVLDSADGGFTWLQMAVSRPITATTPEISEKVIALIRQTRAIALKKKVKEARLKFCLDHRDWANEGEWPGR